MTCPGSASKWQSRDLHPGPLASKPWQFLITFSGFPLDENAVALHRAIPMLRESLFLALPHMEGRLAVTLAGSGVRLGFDSHFSHILQP